MRAPRGVRWACAAACLVLAGPAAAQRGGRVAEEAAVAGGEAERYLRALQVAGLAPAHPLSIRALSPRETHRLVPDSGHPWARPAAAARRSGVRGGLLRPGAGLAWNSGLPYGFNDGPAWSGRGVTAELRAGLTARAGPVSLRLEPVAFRAENRAFTLVSTRDTGRLVFADPRNPRNIDLPQRFGPGAYGRVDPGESTLRLDLVGVAAGVSTASQQWGPADAMPLVLGNNGGGFAHAFAGTASPWRTPLGRVHGRVVWGWLDQSEYSPMRGHGSRRYATGAVAVWEPRGLSGLEVGGARFFHLAWPQGGLRGSDLLKVLEGITKSSVDSTGVGPDGRSSTDNQLASVFARWVFPRSGMEAYAELAREDHSWDLLDFTLEPDHQAAYTVGVRKVWRGAPGRLVALRAELQNSQPSHLAAVRKQHPFYRHDNALQGHTHRGQVLGSPFAYGGGGSVLGVDAYHPRGRWSAEWVRARVGGGLDGAPPEALHALGAEALFFGPGFDVRAGLT
ncbi:MAG TPA: hypothetical protein VEY93_04025, partial [Longimicrobium sp.]|nr:hypothetical protein [Longimicrobium sp.]